MTICTASFCAILIYLEAGAYIAIMLAVLGVPQMLTYYLERRDRHRDRTETHAEAERRHQESRAEEERRHQESRAEEERRHQENLAERERNRAEAERHHQETIAMITGLIAAMTQDRQPSDNHSQAIANLQQAVTELTNQVSQLSERIQNGNGSNRPNAQHND